MGLGFNNSEYMYVQSLQLVKFMLTTTTTLDIRTYMSKDYFDLDH